MSRFSAIERLKREFQEFRRYPDNSVRIEMVGERWNELRGMLMGPINTPYEGGTFYVEVHIPDLYPFRPPNMRFLTKVWHPNISSVTGAICMDILKSQWVADLTLRTVLLSLQGLLNSPEPNDPQDAVVARQAIDDLSMFKQTARHWTNIYADGPIGLCEYDFKVNKLLVMGFEEHASRVALSSNCWDISRAVEYLTE